MSSERRPLSRATRRRLFTSLPWLAWGGAVVVALWLGGSVSAVGVAPAEAERSLVELSSPRTATIVEVRVTPGAAVKAGEVVAVLDPSEVDLEIAVAESELERLRLNVSAEGTSLKADELVTRERLVSDVERAAVDGARLSAELGGDRAELSALDEQIARQRKLVADGLASGGALDELELRRAALGRKVSEYETLLQQAKSHLAAGRARLAEWERTGKVGAPRTAPLIAAVKAQQDRVSALRAARARLTLRAPMSGRVHAVHDAAGSAAREGEPLVTLIDERPTRVVAWLPEDRAQRVHVGDLVQLAPSDGVGDERHGRVVALGAGIEEKPLRFRQIPQEPEQARAVYVKLEGEQPSPLPGQAFDARFLPSESAP